MRQTIFYLIWLFVFLPLSLMVSLGVKNEGKLVPACKNLDSPDSQNIGPYLLQKSNLILWPVILALGFGLGIGIIADTLIKTSPFLYPLF